MRRFSALLLAVFLLCSLCACHAEPPVGSTAAAPSDIDTTTAPSNTYTTTPDGTTAPSVDVDIALKTDGWVNIENVEARDSIFAFGGYYHCAEMGGQILAFTDISNGNTVVLCSKAGCKHHAETSESKQQKCDAYLGSNVFFLHVYGDKIYYNSNDDGYGGIDLYCRNADGTGKQKIAELGTQYVTPESSIEVGYYFPVGSKLYYKIDVKGSVQRDDGVYEVQQIKQVLMCVDLSTGKETLIGEFTDEHPHMIAAREDQLLFYSLGKTDAYKSDGSVDKEALNALPVCLKVWDEDVKQIDVVFEKTAKECSGQGFVIGSKYYYNGTTLDEDNQEFSSWFAYDLTTGEVEISELNTYPLDERFLLYETSVYDTQEKVSLPNDFSAQGLFVLDQGDEGFILEKVYWKEGTGGWKEADYIVYAYVTYDALADGLQSADCLDFLTIDR